MGNHCHTIYILTSLLNWITHNSPSQIFQCPRLWDLWCTCWLTIRYLSSGVSEDKQYTASGQLLRVIPQQFLLPLSSWGSGSQPTVQLDYISAQQSNISSSNLKWGHWRCSEDKRWNCPNYLGWDHNRKIWRYETLSDQ